MIIVTNVIAKASFILMSKKLMKLRRDGIIIGGFDFALITAYAKLRILIMDDTQWQSGS